MPAIPHVIKTTLLLALAFFLMADPAQAHKIKIFAMVEGETVTGYAYAPGGVRLPHNSIEIFNGNKEKIGTIKTDTNGAFSFTPKERSNLSFEMDTSDGHRTSFLITAEELPTRLPATVSQAASAEPPPAIEALPRSATPPELVTLIDRAVAHNIRPLREQIETYEEKIRLHDILGGIGYIMGLAGIFAYWQALKKEKANSGM